MITCSYDTIDFTGGNADMKKENEEKISVVLQRQPGMLMGCDMVKN
jgi:hypothetical protein